VLVADDHADLTKAVCRLLADDYEVVGTVADGRAVVATAQQLQPDVIVLDLNFSEIDGLEVCRQITRAHPEIKVVMFTAKDDPDTRQESFDAGAAAFVCKLSGDLLSAIHGLTGPNGA
jgi:DNA-binding NarL/FixJ family response regulator